MLVEIPSIKNHFSFIRAESQLPYDISEFERMSIENGKYLKRKLQNELQQAFDELEKFDSPVEPEEENWETQ